MEWGNEAAERSVKTTGKGRGAIALFFAERQACALDESAKNVFLSCVFLPCFIKRRKGTKKKRPRSRLRSRPFRQAEAKGVWFGIEKESCAWIEELFDGLSLIMLCALSTRPDTR